MKKTLINYLSIPIIGLLISGGSINKVSAQKFAYVDSKYILENISEYKAAQEQLNKISVEWQKEIEARYAEIDKLYKSFQAEQILLSSEMKRKREDEIVNKEKSAKNLQKKRFGVDGDLYKKRQELIKPIQDKVYAAIKDIAVTGNYAMVLDKAGELSILYSDPKYDKSEEVLNKMGYKASK
ncbi:MAG TPA: OmpH family outer membrane protein [Flavobacteriales bacterium]|nr:OmpH family outer membrane protein [Flavobacteriales bacterium]HIN40292.1 OmpH family outer membrane protein [Flavobacteriales bacterium]